MWRHRVKLHKHSKSRWSFSLIALNCNWLFNRRVPYLDALLSHTAFSLFSQVPILFFHFSHSVLVGRSVGVWLAPSYYYIASAHSSSSSSNNNVVVVVLYQKAYSYAVGRSRVASSSFFQKELCMCRLTRLV